MQRLWRKDSIYGATVQFCYHVYRCYQREICSRHSCALLYRFPIKLSLYRSIENTKEAEDLFTAHFQSFSSRKKPFAQRRSRAHPGLRTRSLQEYGSLPSNKWIKASIHASGGPVLKTRSYSLHAYRIASKPRNPRRHPSSSNQRLLAVLFLRSRAFNYSLSLRQ